MSKFSCLVLSIVVVSVYAGTAQNVQYLMRRLDHECADDKNKEYSAIQSLSDIPLCEWSCKLKKTGFMDDKGQYTPYRGLTYIKNLIFNDDLSDDMHNYDYYEMYKAVDDAYYDRYATLEPIAKKCESEVNDIEVSDGSAGCERVYYLAMCITSYDKM
ncbi:hypothetical protein PYW07_012216 [Mythimna separata]|uniref:Uncharacterized protein n=1 Tax=Mythimna separata TaxID=271217 RepID=A0AAD7YLQ2_MYTSE|nr:hypothetical protein PYW07_012216 [Mythimna separata]